MKFKRTFNLFRLPSWKATDGYEVHIHVSLSMMFGVYSLHILFFFLKIKPLGRGAFLVYFLVFMNTKQKAPLTG